MKFAYSWLKDLVEIKLSPEKLAEFLSLHAFETEITSDQKTFPGIIVAKVTKVEKHPNADRLRVVELTDGRETYSPVVCGAWNFDVGAIVPLALPGAVIPHDQHDPEGKQFVLSKAKIRGIESQGMICSAKELGLGSDGGGIMVLGSNYKLGETLEVKGNGQEALLDVSVPANRPDLVSYRGVAWEIAALTNSKFKVKNNKSKLKELKSKVLKIRVSDPQLCKKYVAVRLGNIKVGPSPKFIQDRLKLSGLRPINNVVDITNYVMLEIGQPLHAFDARTVIGAINVRKAYLNEAIKTLDGVDRKLSTDILVIADSKKALAVAGVMGGLESAVTENSTEIILEAANFNAVSVRRTARKLGLRSDASSRFEKSLPIGFINIAVEYAAELLAKYTGARALEYASAKTKPEKKSIIKLDSEKINTLLGTNISDSLQKKILAQFGFQFLSGKNLQVPFWRPDVKIWQDLGEEILRFEGLDKISPAKIPLPYSSQMTDKSVDARHQVSDLLVGLGFDEVYTYSFVTAEDLVRWNIDKKETIGVANPLSSDQEFLRPNLALNILKVAEHNTKDAEQESGKYFEIGNIYWKDSGKILEKTYLFLLTFPRTKKRTEEFLGNLKDFFQRLGIDIDVKQTEAQSADILIAGKAIGRIVVLPGISELEWLGINLDFEELLKYIKPKELLPISKFPSTSLDSSILIGEEVSWSEIKKLILGTKQKLIKQIILIEGFYQGKEITPGKKSITFRIVYQAVDRTLTRQEISYVHAGILAQLQSKMNAQIRD